MEKKKKEPEWITKFKLFMMKYRDHVTMEGWAEKTIKGYLFNLKYFLDYLVTQDVEEINQITKDVIYRYQMYLNNCISKRGTVLSLATQLDRLVSLRSFFRFLVRRGFLLYDPSSSIELPKTKKNLPTGIMTEAEVLKLLNKPDVETAHGLRDKAVLELLYSTGIRNTELRNLMVYDIDLVNLEVRINMGKGRKDRVVPLGAIAARYVEEYKNNSRPFFMKRRTVFYLSRLKEQSEKIQQDNNLLFFGGRGHKLTVGGVDDIIRKYVKKAKIKKPVTPHAIRHTCATHLLRGKASLRHIQEMLGHNSIATTQRYTHVEVSDLKREHRKCHPREQIK